MKNAKRRQKHKIEGTTTRPRLSVFRSNKAIYAQIINDETGKTLVAASEKEIKLSTDKATKTKKAYQVGELLARKALEKKIKTVVFDRGTYRYQGRIKALADGARNGGLGF